MAAEAVACVVAVAAEAAAAVALVFAVAAGPRLWRPETLLRPQRSQIPVRYTGTDKIIV